MFANIYEAKARTIFIMILELHNDSVLKYNSYTSEIEYDNELLDINSVITGLEKILTEDRLEKIETVIAKRNLDIGVVLENIHDRGNTSAVMRSAEAYGYVNFSIVNKPDMTFKAANRVTQGADKWIDAKEYSSTKKCVTELKKNNYQVFATDLNATTKIEAIDFSKPTAVVFGNEKDGVTDELLDLCDGRFIIPMYGFSQSFNISVASALTFQFIHQKLQQEASKTAPAPKDAISEKRYKALKAWYYIQSINASAQEQLKSLL